MITTTAAFWHWLVKHGIDPAKVELLIVADDIVVCDAMRSALKHEVRMVPGPLTTDDFANFKMHDIQIRTRWRA